MSIHVQSRSLMQRNITVDFRLPLDTMVQGHLYLWPDKAWLKAEWRQHAVRLVSIEGDDSTRYQMAEGNNDGQLIIRPMRRGTHAAAFIFLLDTVRIVVRKAFTVLPNHPPLFRSRLTASEYDRNQLAEYTPVVTDEDGDSITLTVVNAAGNARPLARGSLRLPTGQAGNVTLVLAAADPYGNTARQQIFYTVKLAAGDPARYPYIWYVQKENRMSGDAGFACGAFRVGLYTANVSKTLTHGFLGLATVESPFLYFGANPLGDRQSAMGNYLFFDWGINVRSYGNRILGGGALGRLQANYCQDGTSPWRFQTSFTMRLKQIYFYVNTSGLGDEMRKYVTAGPDSQINEDVKHLTDIFNDYGKNDNLGIYFRLQTLYRLGSGFWAGPSAWIEDDIKAPPMSNPSVTHTTAPSDTAGANDRGNFLVQYTGLCVMHEWRSGWFAYSQQLNLGWGGRGLSPNLHWNFIIQAIKKRR